MKSKIQGLLRRKYKNIDLLLQSHILNHICVLISGYLEKEITNILVNYKGTTHFRLLECQDTNKVKNISHRQGQGIQNAKWCSIRPVFFSIDIKIIMKLEKLSNFRMIVDSIDNIVRTRHKIAHGENVTNLTLQVLKDDFKNINRFLKKLNSIFTTL